MPNIPDMNPDISLDKEDALHIILSSIGMEELSLSHILNAEAEKIQFALGTLNGFPSPAYDMCTILEVNKSSARVLRDVIKNQILLLMKLEDVIELIPVISPNPPHPPCPPVPPHPPCPPVPPHPPCPPVPPHPPCPPVPPHPPCPPVPPHPPCPPVPPHPPCPPVPPHPPCPPVPIKKQSFYPNVCCKYRIVNHYKMK